MQDIWAGLIQSLVCLCSMYQMWIYILYETLMASQQQLLQHVSQHVPL